MFQEQHFWGDRRAFHLQLQLGEQSDIKHRLRKSNYRNKRPHFHAPTQSFDEQKRTLDPKMTSLLLSIIFFFFYHESKGKLRDLNCNVNVIGSIVHKISLRLRDGRTSGDARLVGRSLKGSRMRSCLTEVEASVPSYDR